MELLDFRSSRSNPNRMMMEIVLEQWAQTKIDILFTFGKIMNYYVLYRKITKTNSEIFPTIFLGLFDKRSFYTETLHFALTDSYKFMVKLRFATFEWIISFIWQRGHP